MTISDKSSPFQAKLDQYYRLAEPEEIEKEKPEVKKNIINLINNVFKENKPVVDFSIGELDFPVNGETLVELVVLAAKELRPNYNIITDGIFDTKSVTSYERFCRFRATKIS